MNPNYKIIVGRRMLPDRGIAPHLNNKMANLWQFLWQVSPNKRQIVEQKFEKQKSDAIHESL